MTAAPARVAVVGSINMDIAVRAVRLPAPGETLHGQSAALSLGGKGANQAVAARRLGADVTFVGLTGADGFGDIARERLSGFGLSLDLIGTSPDAGTGIATIGIDSAGQNAIVVVAGANGQLGLAEVERARTALSAARVLLLQCETPVAASIAAARIVRDAGGLVILDPAPVPAAGIDPALIPLVDVVTPNESEARALTGLALENQSDAHIAARTLCAMGFRSVVVKLGGQGLVWHSATENGVLPPYKVTVVDTVAAGDCFNGGLATALARGESLGAALAFANACGALAVTRAGASDAAPTAEDVRIFRANPAVTAPTS